MHDHKRLERGRTGHILDNLVQLASITASSAKLLGTSIFGESEIALEQLRRGTEDGSCDYLLAGVRERLAERARLRQAEGGREGASRVQSGCAQGAISVPHLGEAEQLDAVQRLDRRPVAKFR